MQDISTKLIAVVMFNLSKVVEFLQNVDGFRFSNKDDCDDENDESENEEQGQGEQTLVTSQVDGFPFFTKKKTNTTDDADEDEGTLPIVNSTISKDSYIFPMNYKHRGRAIIFNHFKFVDMDSRTGTDVDEKNLKKRLSALNFDIKVHTDLKYGEIYETLQTVASDEHEDVGCLLVIVLTHGESNTLYAYDHKYPADILWTPFIGNKCPSLIGKPKIFLLQACRGEGVDAGVMLRSANVKTDSSSTSAPTYTIPAMADILIMYSTYDGYYSWRSPLEGSWFIQSLCKELEQHATKHDFVTILTFVNRRMAIDFESNVPDVAEMHGKKQIGSIVSTLTRLLYLYEHNLVEEA